MIATLQAQTRGDLLFYFGLCMVATFGALVMIAMFALWLRFKFTGRWGYLKVPGVPHPLIFSQVDQIIDNSEQYLKSR